MELTKKLIDQIAKQALDRLRPEAEHITENTFCLECEFKEVGCRFCKTAQSIIRHTLILLSDEAAKMN